MFKRQMTVVSPENLDLEINYSKEEDSGESSESDFEISLAYSNK